MLDQLAKNLLGFAEIGGNHLLGMDPQVLQHCTGLQGNIIAIELTDLDKTIYCHPGSWGMRLSLQQPGKEVDSTIRGHLLGLVNLSIQQEKMSTSMQERIEIIGNPSVAQKFQKILTELNIDWEEELSKHTGDIMAYRIGQGVRKTHRTFKDITSSLALSGREYLQEESHHMPTLPEFEKFQQEVTNAKHDVDRLEAKLNYLLKKTLA